MQPVDQTRIGENGNCFQASIASILELPLEAVPDFCNKYEPDEYFRHFAKWLRKFKLVPATIYRGHPMFDFYFNNCLCEATVASLDHPGLQHSVVVCDGVIVHDPHPSKRSLQLTPDKILEICVFVMQRPLVSVTRPRKLKAPPPDVRVILRQDISEICLHGAGDNGNFFIYDIPSADYAEAKHQNNAFFKEDEVLALDGEAGLWKVARVWRCTPLHYPVTKLKVFLVPQAKG